MAGRAHLRVKPARFLRIAAVVVLVASAALAASWRITPAQADAPAKHLAAGKILVARRSLADPNFAETVIVLVQYDEDGTLGLIVNRQTKLPLSRLARDLEGAKGRTEPLYLGGPVAMSGIMGLIRTAAKLEDGKHVFGDVYMISSKSAVEKAMASNSDPKTFRLYLGYAGWDAGQLEFEMGMDAWDVLPANPAMVFDSHPETLWDRLVQQEDLRIAAVHNVAHGFPVTHLPVNAAN
jgi:putative transcriptional regulator